MELKHSDLKLLTYLYSHAREPSTKIAKAIGLSREQVDYKIKKLLDSGTIKKFGTIFNYGALGYSFYALLMIKFSKQIYAKKFHESKEKDGNLISKGIILNKYDIFMNLVFKDENEFRNYLSSFLEKQKGKISDYLIVNPYFAELYPLKFLENRQEILMWNISSDKISLDKKDIQILKMLEKDGRERIVDIAASLKVSPELILYNIKKLYEKKIIVGQRIAFDMKRLGYSLSIVSMNFKNPSRENMEKIKSFAKKSKYANTLILSVSNPNCFIQFFHKSIEELRKEIKDIKELFDNEEISIDVLFVEAEEEINTLPFL